MRISASQIDPVPLERLKSMFGGSVHQRTRKGSLGNQPVWVWTVHGLKAPAVFEQLRPYFVGQSKVEKFDRLVAEKQPRRGGNH